MYLAISTATAACSVALLDDDIIVANQHEVVGRGHAERLIPMIAALPGKGRADAIWVDCGPGSFTGVRVGLAAARALALAWGVPLHGFSTMALIAAGLEDAPATFTIALQGGHGELFVQDFSAGPPLAAATPLASLPPVTAGAQHAASLVIGSGAIALFEARGTGEAREALPRAADVRRLPEALRNLPPDPIYGRAPDAVRP